MNKGDQILTGSYRRLRLPDRAVHLPGTVRTNTSGSLSKTGANLFSPMAGATGDDVL